MPKKASRGKRFQEAPPAPQAETPVSATTETTETVETVETASETVTEATDTAVSENQDVTETTETEVTQTAEEFIRELEAYIAAHPEAIRPEELTDEHFGIDAISTDVVPSSEKSLSVVQQAKKDLTDEYMSRSLIFKFLRKRYKTVSLVIKDMADRKKANRQLLHQILVVGDLSCLSFFETEPESFTYKMVDGVRHVTGYRKTTTINKMVDTLKRAGGTSLTVDDVHTLRRRLKAENRVPRLFSLTNEERKVLGLPELKPRFKAVASTKDPDLSSDQPIRTTANEPATEPATDAA